MLRENTARLWRLNLCATLESVTRAMVAAINDCDFNKPVEARRMDSYVASDFLANFDTCDFEISWEQLKAIWRKRFSEDEACHFDIISLAVDVSEATGYATVLTEIEVKGVDGVRLVGINELRWRCDDGVWVVYYYTHFRGICPNAGFVTMF